MTAAVRFESVSKRFPGVQAMNGVTLEIAAGSCHALCGENGAGKSTLGKVLAGIHVPDEGRVVVHGQDTSCVLGEKPVSWAKVAVTVLVALAVLVLIILLFRGS